jgi:hypothetical protein
MNRIKKIKEYYNWGGRFLTDPFHIRVAELNQLEASKQPSRTEVINFLLNSLQRTTVYLEIGVRNPSDNFDLIKADEKYSVDPGLEYEANPVDFVMTSDQFFHQMKANELAISDRRFDVVFIDGLHTAQQVDLDIQNALDFIKEDGFIVLHDCNPPTEWHAREEHHYRISPAMNNWNGTTWKGFVKHRNNPELYSCCIDTDWGVGIISKTKKIGKVNQVQNEFYEFSKFDTNRKEILNLIKFEELQKKL